MLPATQLARFLPTVDGSGNKEYFYLGLFRQLDKKFFILFNGKDKVRDWLGFTKNFSHGFANRSLLLFWALWVVTALILKKQKHCLILQDSFL